MVSFEAMMAIASSQSQPVTGDEHIFVKNYSYSCQFSEEASGLIVNDSAFWAVTGWLRYCTLFFCPAWNLFCVCCKLYLSSHGLVYACPFIRVSSLINLTLFSNYNGNLIIINCISLSKKSETTIVRLLIIYMLIVVIVGFCNTHISDCWFMLYTRTIKVLIVSILCLYYVHK